MGAPAHRDVTRPSREAIDAAEQVWLAILKRRYPTYHWVTRRARKIGLPAEHQSPIQREDSMIDNEGTIDL